MKIVILGSIYFNVNVQLDSAFDLAADNEGRAVVSCGGLALDFAKKLLEDGHEVLFVTSINSQMHVPITRLFKKLGLSTDYLVWEANGVGFKINLTDSSTHTFESTVCGQDVIEFLESKSDELLSTADVIVTDYVEPRAAKLISTYNAKLAWLADPDDLARFDSDDVDLHIYTDVPVITAKNYKGVLR